MKLQRQRRPECFLYKLGRHWCAGRVRLKLRRQTGRPKLTRRGDR